jgi:tetratricopeptide (TPR) repeat protein
LLSYHGTPTTPTELIDLVYIPELKGSLQIEMSAATRHKGFLAYELSPTFDALFKEISADNPVIVLLNLGLEIWPNWHYAVVIGYDLKARSVILHSGTKSYYKMKLSTFEHSWRRAKNWGLIASSPGTLTNSMNENDYFTAAVSFERVNSILAIQQVYQAGISQWPSSRLLNLAYANYLYTQKELDQSIYYYRQTLHHHPHEPAAHNNLAQVLKDLGKYEQALLHARKAVELGGDQYANRYTQTLEEIESALQLEYDQ